MELTHIVRDSAPNPNIVVPQYVGLGWHIANVNESEIINHSGNTNEITKLNELKTKKKYNWL